jgi:osmoprotectant transport system ATP-binding protein
MIQYENVTKIFGSGPQAITAVNDVTLQIEKGNLVTLLGPSGCGKTTLLRLTNRLIPLTHGTIKVKGRDIQSEDPVKLRQSMGYAIQAIGLFPNKTIFENIATVPRLLKWEAEAIRNRVEELLVMLQLDPDDFRNRYPAELSGGQQQRIGVARCLAADPELLLMDEPFGAIDPINREDIQDAFLRVQQELKKTIIFVTHDIHEAIKMGDRIAILHEGGLVQYDAPEAILTHPKNEYIADFVGADRALKVLGLLRVADAVNRRVSNIVQPSQDAQEVLEFLQQKDLSHAVVVHGKRPVSYVTKEMLIEQEGSVKPALKAFPQFLTMGDTLRDAIASLLMHNMDVLCVMDENEELVGTVTMKDIRKAILDTYREEKPS